MANFIVCPGRCGSTHLGTFLSNLPEFQVISETWSYRTNRQALLSGDRLTPDEFVRQLTAPVPHEALPILKAQQRAKDTNDAVLNIAHQRLEPLRSQDFRILFNRTRGQRPLSLQSNAQEAFSMLCSKHRKPTWIEKTGGSQRYAQSLFEHFPDARFVILERDPYSVARSKSQHPGFILGFLFRHQSELESNLVQVLKRGSVRAAERAVLTTLFLKNEYRHKEVLDQLLQRTPPKHFFRCSYELMVQHPDEFFRGILEFLANRRPTNAELKKFLSQTRLA